MRLAIDENELAYLKHSGDDTWLLIRALHRVGLAGGRHTVGEDSNGLPI